MPDDSVDQLGMSAALARSYAEDQHGFLPGLGALLEGVLPESTQVERKAISFFSSKKRVVGITVNLEDYVYTLHEGAREGQLVAQRVRIVRGVKLKTDTITVPVWLADISGILNDRAKESEQTLYALKEFLKS